MVFVQSYFLRNVNHNMYTKATEVIKVNLMSKKKSTFFLNKMDISSMFINVLFILFSAFFANRRQTKGKFFWWDFRRVHAVERRKKHGETEGVTRGGYKKLIYDSLRRLLKCTDDVPPCGSKKHIHAFPGVFVLVIYYHGSHAVLVSMKWYQGYCFFGDSCREPQLIWYWFML